eukprot:scaffold72434_cov23-Tisochrysis_lutea.AAC.1
MAQRLSRSSEHQAVGSLSLKKQKSTSLSGGPQTSSSGVRPFTSPHHPLDQGRQASNLKLWGEAGWRVGYESCVRRRGVFGGGEGDKCVVLHAYM